MATETLYATSLTSGAVSTSANALGAPNGTFTTDTDNTNWTARFAMGNPVGNTANGTHSITLRIRKETGTGNPTITSVAVHAGATQLAINSTGWTVTSTTGADIVVNFASSIFSGVDLSTIEVQIVATSSGGSPSARSTPQLDGITWSGDFTTAVPPNAGSGSGTLAFVGTATGTTPALSPNSGSGSGVLALNGTAAGSTVKSGSGSGVLDFNGTASGTAPVPGANSGSGAGTLAFNGTASGTAPAVSGTPSGSGSGALAFNGTASGSTTKSGSGSGVLALAGTATGSAPADPEWRFTPPTRLERVGFNAAVGYSDLWARVPKEQGLAVVFYDDGRIVTTSSAPSAGDDGVTTVWPGGRTYTITESQADLLTAAGYSSNLEFT